MFHTRSEGSGRREGEGGKERQMREVGETEGEGGGDEGMRGGRENDHDDEVQASNSHSRRMRTIARPTAPLCECGSETVMGMLTRL